MGHAALLFVDSLARSGIRREIRQLCRSALQRQPRSSRLTSVHTKWCKGYRKDRFISLRSRYDRDPAKEETPSPRDASTPTFSNASSQNGVKASEDPVPFDAGSVTNPETNEMMAKQNEKERSVRDNSRLAALLAMVGVVGALIRVEWVEHNTMQALWILFCSGYAGIILEDILEFHKAGAALLMAVALWSALALASPTTESLAAGHQPVLEAVGNSMAEVAPLLFFLLGAMSIVEIVDGHRGFRTVTDAIQTQNPIALLWIISLITFFMSAVLDNLTTTIVMVSILRQLVPPSTRLLVGAAVVVAANCGGVATPLGDVTTTMLWIGGQITTAATIRDLLLPSFISLLVSLSIFSPMVAKAAEAENQSSARQKLEAAGVAPRGRLVFFCGVASLLFVPVFKAATGLPPYMGMLLGLGFMWLLTDLLHAGEPERIELRATRALARIDQSSILFFLGILMSVGALESAGALQQLAGWLDSHLAVRELTPTVIGLASSVIDNVPLVAATMGMYELSQHPADSELWQLIAYCAGTGGSILIIGSAAGVAYMGMEKVGFFWYLRNASIAALAGYFAGILVYLSIHSEPLQRAIHHLF
jgi:Na+/H+ antiporter NhaD/arsenite permease-like protein